MAPECLRRTQLSEVGWQSIPHSWSGDTECTVSELRFVRGTMKSPRLAVRRAGRLTNVLLTRTLRMKSRTMYVKILLCCKSVIIVCIHLLTEF